MGARYGAWAQLLALFRLIHDGGRHGSVRFTRGMGGCLTPTRIRFSKVVLAARIAARVSVLRLTGV
jgi:hypothetical protein